MIFNRYLSAILLINTMSASSLFAMISYLKLDPDKACTKVILPFQYYSPSYDEKQRVKDTPEGNVTVLKKEGDCAIVGPLNPCQAVELYNANKAIIGHLCCNANKESLLDYAEDEYIDCNISQTTGLIFTNNSAHYEAPYVRLNTKNLSLKDLYEGRTQLEELKLIKDTIIKRFGIEDRNQIEAYKFNTKMKDYELGDYEYAEMFVWFKFQEQQKPARFSICPMAENLYGNFQHIPCKDRCSLISQKLHARYEKNPYLSQFVRGKSLMYGVYPFVKI